MTSHTVSVRVAKYFFESISSFFFELRRKEYWRGSQCKDSTFLGACLGYILLCILATECGVLLFLFRLPSSRWSHVFPPSRARLCASRLLLSRMLQNGSGQPTLITLHDAVTDSPVYRANALHFDEQVELLEKWLDSLSKHLRQYTEKLNSNYEIQFQMAKIVFLTGNANAEFNLETNNVCKKTIPTGIDDTLIGKE